MCGIFGYVGKRNAVATALAGLRRLEYRGYDSMGLGGVSGGEIHICKEVGRIGALEKSVREQHFNVDIAIAHSRWATHGKPTRENAHPHTDSNNSLAIVHNGIIENHEELRRLLPPGTHFVSETDTEVVAHLIAQNYKGNLLQALQEVVPLLQGSYAIAVVHRDHPNKIVAVAYQMPLAVGLGEGESFLASDPHAFAEHTRDVLFLTNREIAVIHADKVEVFNVSKELIVKPSQLLSIDSSEMTKGQFEHFTLKEIYQQPQAIRSALLSRLSLDYGNAVFDEMSLDMAELFNVQRIQILACGTSYHAGCLGGYMLEDRARIATHVEIASEFRYKNPVISPDTFVIAISQSGETADTIAAVREVKAKGARVLAICNVPSSTLIRESDAYILLRAGPEIGVCSTKAFTSQVVVLALFTLLMARMRHMSKHEGQQFLKALQELSEKTQIVLDRAQNIEAIAKKYSRFDNFFFVGRRYMFPTSLEGALKLKEISYVNANGYPAGELKHGPIALLNKNCPTVALCANRSTLDKLRANLQEIQARDSPIIAIAEEGTPYLEEIVDDIIWIPSTIDELATIPTTVATQLFAYYVAKERGAEIDHPRNLAKSVTVE